MAAVALSAAEAKAISGGSGGVVGGNGGRWWVVVAAAVEGGGCGVEGGDGDGGGGGGWRCILTVSSLYPHCILTVSSLYPSKERCLRSPAEAEGGGWWLRQRWRVVVVEGCRGRGWRRRRVVEAEGGIITYQNIVRRRKNVLIKTKMNQCPICYQSFSRSDAMLRHKRNVHMKEKYIDPLPSVVKSTNMSFKRPFSMVVSGPSGSGKSVWTKKLLLSSLIQPSPERIIWCYGQWQPLYDNIRKRIPRIEFVNGIPDHLNDQHYINVGKRNLLVFDDLMTEAKCDQRIADLFTKGSQSQKEHIRSVSHSKFISSREGMPGYHFEYTVYGTV